MPIRKPSSTPEYVTIIDNKGKRKISAFAYVVRGIKDELVYVTTDGLAYTRDSLTLKRYGFLLTELEKLPNILSQPDLVIWDPVDDPGETLIYYKRIFVSALQLNGLVGYSKSPARN